MLVSAFQSASDFGLAHFRETAQRALHVPHHIAIVSFMKSLQSVCIKQVKRFQGGRWQQKCLEYTSQKAVEFGVHIHLLCNMVRKIMRSEWWINNPNEPMWDKEQTNESYGWTTVLSFKAVSLPLIMNDQFLETFQQWPPFLPSILSWLLPPLQPTHDGNYNCWRPPADLLLLHWTATY